MKPATKSAVVVAIIVLIGAGVFALTREKDTTVSSDDSSKTKQSTEVAGSDLAGFVSKEQVALHATKDDCWTITDGGVYDITSYIPRHQGGDNILSACGVDATEFFNGEKAGQSGGTNDHGSTARNQLEKLKIGQIIN